MPQSTPERRARWGVDLFKAAGFLSDRGFRYTYKEHCWVLPCDGHVLTDDERDAICFLVEEWDYGGTCVPPSRVKRPKRKER